MLTGRRWVMVPSSLDDAVMTDDNEVTRSISLLSLRWRGGGLDPETASLSALMRSRSISSRVIFLEFVSPLGDTTSLLR